MIFGFKEIECIEPLVCGFTLWFGAQWRRTHLEHLVFPQAVFPLATRVRQNLGDALDLAARLGANVPHQSEPTPAAQ